MAERNKFTFLARPWIEQALLDKRCAKKVKARIMKIGKENPDGSHEATITDYKLSVTAIFTKDAISNCLSDESSGHNHTSFFQMLHGLVVILKFKVMPRFETREFFVSVEEFKLYPGFTDSTSFAELRDEIVESTRLTSVCDKLRSLWQKNNLLQLYHEYELEDAEREATWDISDVLDHIHEAQLNYAPFSEFSELEDNFQDVSATRQTTVALTSNVQRVEVPLASSTKSAKCIDDEETPLGNSVSNILQPIDVPTSKFVNDDQPIDVPTSRCFDNEESPLGNSVSNILQTIDVPTSRCIDNEETPLGNSVSKIHQPIDVPTSKLIEDEETPLGNSVSKIHQRIDVPTSRCIDDGETALVNSVLKIHQPIDVPTSKLIEDEETPLENSVSKIHQRIDVPTSRCIDDGETALVNSVSKIHQPIDVTTSECMDAEETPRKDDIWSFINFYWRKKSLEYLVRIQSRNIHS